MNENDEKLIAAAKQRLDDAVRETQEQSKEAAAQLGALLRFGAKKLKDAAGKASQAIADDLNKRP